MLTAKVEVGELLVVVNVGFVASASNPTAACNPNVVAPQPEAAVAFTDEHAAAVEAKAARLQKASEKLQLHTQRSARVAQ